MLIFLPVISFIVFFVLNKKYIKITRPDILTVVFIRDYIFLSSFGYIYYGIIKSRESHYILIKLRSEDSIYDASLFAFLFIVIFCFFYIIFRSLAYRVSCNIKWNFPTGWYIYILSVFTVINTVLIIYFMFVFKAGIIALLSGLSAREAGELRALLSRGDGILSFLKLATNTWIPMTSFVWLYLWFNERDRLSGFQRFLVLISIIAGILASVWALEKAKIAFYMIGLVAVWLYAGGVVKVYQWIALLCAALVLVAVGYLATYGDRITGFEYIAAIVEHRVMTQSVGSIVAFELYPEILPFKGLSGISNYLASFSGNVFSSPYSDIIDYMVPEQASISGAMSSFAAGEAYALFGTVGVLCGAVLAAFYYGSLEATKYMDKARIFFVPLYAMFFSFPYLASSFYSFFWPVGWVLAMAPFVMMAVLAELFSRVAK